MPKAENGHSFVAQNQTFVLSAALVLGTLLLYWPVTGSDFVVVDDGQYVSQNPWVMHGVTWPGLMWAFTTTDAANWHPITWLSHLLDYSLYGIFAGGHHLTNLLLHAANALLLFLMLKRLTRSQWPPLLAAALFAWHPLHVESVAWIAERKDVLSTFFLLLTIAAYARYADQPSRRRYALTLALFALGLMTKPMLVTLPCLLLLLDYWPLGRVTGGGRPTTGTNANAPASGSPVARYRSLLREKIPFFALSLASCVITVIAQRAGGAVRSVAEVPLSLRAPNALIAVATYLGKTFWPANLCVFYPLPGKISAIATLAAALLLAGITVLLYRRRLASPWLIVGWLWFLGTLVPVSGLVQVGQQALADRYTYIPLIGVFVAFAWSVAKFVQARPALRLFAIAAVAFAVVAAAAVTRVQVGYWHNSLTLLQRALAVTGSNAFVENNLGVALSAAGQGAEAIQHYQTALRFEPGAGGARIRYNLALELAAQGRLDDAVAQFNEALRFNPQNELLHNNLGAVLAQQEKLEPAMEHFRIAIRLNPAYPKPYLNYAVALQKTGVNGAASTNYFKALQLDPDWPEALDKTARFLATCPEEPWHSPPDAVKFATRAVTLTEHRFPSYLDTLALAQAASGDFSNAVDTAEAAQKKAQAMGFAGLAEKLEQDLARYRAGLVPTNSADRK